MRMPFVSRDLRAKPIRMEVQFGRHPTPKSSRSGSQRLSEYLQLCYIFLFQVQEMQKGCSLTRGIEGLQNRERMGELTRLQLLLLHQLRLWVHVSNCMCIWSYWSSTTHSLAHARPTHSRLHSHHWTCLADMRSSSWARHTGMHHRLHRLSWIRSMAGPHRMTMGDAGLLHSTGMRTWRVCCHHLVVWSVVMSTASTLFPSPQSDASGRPSTKPRQRIIFDFIIDGARMKSRFVYTRCLVERSREASSVNMNSQVEYRKLRVLESPRFVEMAKKAGASGKRLILL